MDEPDEEAPTKVVGANRGKPRSPSYPGIALDQALDRARVLYRHEGRNAAPVAAAFSHWGHKPHSGAGGVVLAALKKFGLIQDQGQRGARLIRLTSEALAILLDEREDSSERLARIRMAATRPPIHAELWEQYQSHLPSDATLRFHLLTDRGFTETGADEFIPQLRRTFAFACLNETATLTPEDEPSEDELVTPAEKLGGAPERRGGAVTLVPPLAPPPPPPATPGTRALTVPLPNGAEAVLRIPVSLSEEDWTLMFTVFQAMKPGIVRREESSDRGD